MLKKRWIALFISTAILSLAMFGTLYMYTARDTLPPSVVIAGIELGRLSPEEALKRLEQELAALQQKKVIFTTGDHAQTLTWAEAGISFQARGFREELEHLTHGNLWERAQIRRQFARTWPIHASFDPAALKLIFSAKWETSQFGNPVNAVRTITPDDQIRYSPGTPARRIHWEELKMSLPLQLSRELKRLEQAQESSGMRKPLSKALSPLTISLPTRAVSPEVTIESLKKEGIRRKIVQFSTRLLSSGAGRVHNIDSAARSIDGITLEPNGIFDYEEAIEYAEKTYGFREAPVIFGGKLVPGVGGGICQVSSTLYNAAVRAGLEIIERRNHSLPVSYLPKGQDATFAKGYINFRFQNTSGQHLLIRAEVKNRVLTVKLFGDMPENVSYTIESKTTKTLPALNKYVANPSLPKGSRQILIPGKQGYVVETYRVKRMNGKLVERTQLSRDTYPAHPTVIAVHTTDRAGKKSSQQPRRQLLEDGVTGPNFR
ncbi:VanW family protein [Paenibacillus sanguinis]|uniref:VanW family protein n=1 Tax=Paenibacillus sanguinis TaxID=225906 RepID=UPI00037B1526|nr:VanW family protein [Paenibacillus sanguinis]